MWTLSAAAIALVAFTGAGQASQVDNVEAWYQHARAVVGPMASAEELIDQREVIAPPIGIDPGITATPLDDHSRLRIIKPPGFRDDGLQPK